MTQARASDDAAFWQQAPPGEDGAVPWVDVRFNLKKVNAVDTVAGTAFFNGAIAFYWTDSRLAGWPEGAALPPALWGPRLELSNALGDLQEAHLAFTLVDRATGRLKRGRLYTGTVDNPMELRDFPFDMDRIELHFRTYSTWETRDGELSGSAPGAKTYRVRQVREPGEGKWLVLDQWSGALAEWELHGVSTKIEELPPIVQGEEITVVPVSLHVTRKSCYMVEKTIDICRLTLSLAESALEFVCACARVVLDHGFAQSTDTKSFAHSGL